MGSVTHQLDAHKRALPRSGGGSHKGRRTHASSASWVPPISANLSPAACLHLNVDEVVDLDLVVDVDLDTTATEYAASLRIMAFRDNAWCY
jgi:hypothetical protein